MTTCIATSLWSRSAFVSWALALPFCTLAVITLPFTASASSPDVPHVPLSATEKDRALAHIDSLWDAGARDAARSTIPALLEAARAQDDSLFCLSLLARDGAHRPASLWTGRRAARLSRALLTDRRDRYARGRSRRRRNGTPGGYGSAAAQCKDQRG